MRFDSVVFADSASLAALSCLSRLKSERSAGRRTLLVSLVDHGGADVLAARGLGEVRAFAQIEAAEGTVAPQPWRERISVIIRRFGPKHVMAPLGLLGAPQSIDYFETMRAALSVDPGRDLLFFEERPHSLVPESVLLRLSGLGVRLPPATKLRSPRRYAPFVLRLVSGLGVPPIFGGLRERSRLAGSLRRSFSDAADWDPVRALGPKLQPVIEPWTEEDSTELFELAQELGVVDQLGSTKAFRRWAARHAAGAGSPMMVERYWLSLPDADSSSDSY